MLQDEMDKWGIESEDSEAAYTGGVRNGVVADGTRGGPGDGGKGRIL